MNILVTGSTPQHNGRKNRPGYISVTAMLVSVLKNLGHQVQNRPFDVHSDHASDFDVVIVGMHSFTGLPAIHKYQACECIYQAAEDGIPCFFMLDDWDIKKVINGSRAVMNQPSRITKPLYEYCHEFKWATENKKRRDRIFEACRIVVDPLSWPSCLTPLYPGGEVAKLTNLIPPETLIPWNPASVTPQYAGTPCMDETREARWIFAVLTNQFKWLESLKLEWPVLHAGGKASKADIFLSEVRIFEEMCQSWGSLSCPYWHLGSGWYRIRHCLAVQAGCLIAGDPRELSFIDPSFAVTPQQLENLDLDEARDLRDRQRLAWKTKIESVDAHRQIKAILRDVKKS
jgi:hypothetical protein